MPGEISFELADEKLSHPDIEQMCAWVQATLDKAGKSGDISLCVVDEDQMAELNSRYRGKSGATNVLSFPAELPANLPLELLGDILLCAPVIEREADEQGKSADAHWAHMLVHGTLHLLGYNHEQDEDAAQMEQREMEILAEFGFANPYN